MPSRLLGATYGGASYDMLCCRSTTYMYYIGLHRMNFISLPFSKYCCDIQLEVSWNGKVSKVKGLIDKHLPPGLGKPGQSFS